MSLVKKNWGWIALRGLLAIVFGVLAIMRPGVTVSALVIVFGAYAFIDGSYLFIAAIAERKTEPNWVAFLFAGLAGIAVGITTLVMPGITALALLYYVAAWAMIRGTMEIIAAMRLRKFIKGEWVYVFAGALSIIFGAYLVVRPAMGTLLLMAWLGAYAVIFGIVLVVLAFQLRNAPRIAEL